MPAQLNDFQEKVLKYLFNRKTAATVKQLAKVFARSESYMMRSLRVLEEQQLITVIQAGKTKFYAYKD